jgi:hypothetical protein
MKSIVTLFLSCLNNKVCIEKLILFLQRMQNKFLTIIQEMLAKLTKIFFVNAFVYYIKKTNCKSTMPITLS